MTTRLLPAATRGTALLIGLTGYGFSMAMMVRAGLGLDPWDVFHQGLARHTGMTIGIASAVVGVAVLLAWIPLRNRPGIGTIANVIVIAITVDAGLLVLPTPTSLPVRVAMMLGAVLLNAFSTVLYVGAGLGPGPRDGLMTGLVVRTGLSVGWSARASRRPCWPSAGCWAGPSASAPSSTRSASARWCNSSCASRRVACWPAAAGLPSPTPAMWACHQTRSAHPSAPKSLGRPARRGSVAVRHDGRVPSEPKTMRPTPIC